MRLSPDALISAAATAIAGLAAAFATWRMGHKQANASFAGAVQDAARWAIQELRTECQRLVATNEETRLQLEASRREHQVCREDLAEVKRQIALLMAANPAAVYEPKPPA